MARVTAQTAKTISRGSTYTIGVGPVTKNGVVVNLTGTTLFFTVKANEYDDITLDTSAIIYKNVSTHSDPTHGISAIVLSPDDTFYNYNTEVPITPRTKINNPYYYDIWIDIDINTRYKLDEGIILIDGSPTNRGVDV